MKTITKSTSVLFLLSLVIIACLPCTVYAQSGLASNSSIWGDNNNVQQPTNTDPIWGNQQSSSGSINADADGIPPPPDDPVDVPIDGGVGILLMIGIGIGYRNSRKNKVRSDSTPDSYQCFLTQRSTLV